MSNDPASRSQERIDELDAEGRFFGAAFAERVRSERWARVPECTAIFSARRA